MIYVSSLCTIKSIYRKDSIERQVQHEEVFCQWRIKLIQYKAQPSTVETYICPTWGWRNVFRPNLTLRTMQLNAWVDNIFEILFLHLILSCYSPKMFKHYILFCLLLSFCTTEYLVSITINGMRGCPIILQLLICLFYLLQLNIISLISPKSH